MLEYFVIENSSSYEMKYNEIMYKKIVKIKKSFVDYDIRRISIMKGILCSILTYYSFFYKLLLG